MSVESVPDERGDGMTVMRRWAGNEGAALEQALLAELDEDDAMSAFAVIEKRCAPLAEVERLREALDQIARLAYETQYGSPPVVVRFANRIFDIAEKPARAFRESRSVNELEQ